MTSVEGFIAELAELDIRLSLSGDELHCNAPRQVMTAELRERLAARKPELLDFLSKTAAQSGTDAGLESRRPHDAVPLAPNQERLWSLVQMRPESTLYNISTIFRLKGPLDQSSLERSLGEIQKRHEILRTTFADTEDGSRQLIADPAPVALPVIDILRDLKHLPEERREPEIMELLQAEMRQPFDIRTGPLWRCRLYRTAKNEHILSFTMHHMVFDGRSKPALLRELEEFYRAFSSGGTPEVEELSIQYGDFARWRRQRLDGMAGQRQLDYWTNNLSGGLAPLALPNDRPRRPGASKSDHLTIDVPDFVAERLAALGRDEKTSTYALLLAAFGICLNRYTGQNDLVVCSPMACRDKSELEPMIGYFNNVVAMRLDLSGDPDIREVIRRTRRTVITALDHKDLPLQKLAEVPELARLSLTRGMFSFQDVSSRTLSLPRISAEPIELRKPEADFEISLYMESTGPDGMSGILEYDVELFDRQTIEGLARDFQAVLETISADADRTLSALPRYGTDPSQITTALKEHAQIDDAIVVHRADGPGTLAYLVLNEHDVPEIGDIRGFVRERFPDYAMPAAFTPLDELPLAGDGSIDRDALPVPDLLFGRSEDQPYVAPRNDLERQLCDIWKRVLWLESDIGIHDTFSDLGGHSLLAVQLVLTLEEELDRTVPVRALLQLSTVAEMAEILESGVTDEDQGGDAALHHLSAEVYRGLRTYTSTWKGYRATPDSLIVGMNVDGPRRRLFWCLQRYGELTQLAKYIGDDQPVFGMRSGNSVMVKTPENINALAAHYVEEVLGIQPEGPYLIGGNCQAAKIAFQIARQLQDRGHEIELLMLMEKFVPQPYRGRIANLYGIDSHRNPRLHYRDPLAGWSKYYSGPLSLDLVKGRHSQFFKEPNVQDLAARIRLRIDEAADAAGAGTTETPAARQTLPTSAYRAGLKALGTPSGKPGTSTTISVQLTNRSSTVWRAHEASGIFLANRWLNRKDKPVVPLDGTAPLRGDLAPGETETLEIDIKLPDRPGRYTLEFDLVDDGVTWFAEEGSEPAKISLDIGNPSALARFEGWWHNFTSRARNRFS